MQDRRLSFHKIRPSFSERIGFCIRSDPTKVRITSPITQSGEIANGGLCDGTWAGPDEKE